MEHRTDVAAVTWLILQRHGDPSVYRPDTIRYWLRQGYSPEEIVSVILSVPKGKLTRQEQLQGLADRGVDTWEDY